MEELLNALNAGGLLDEQGKIILERYPNGGYQCVDADTFASMFGSVLDDPEIEDKHAGLLAADPDTETGASRGYARFFDAWHDQGIV